MAEERSIYAYDPRLITEREVKRRIREIADERKGTRSHVRHGETHILTCTCGAYSITQDHEFPARFEADHKECPDVR